VKRTLSKGFYIPDWPAPPNVKAIQTTRDGGYSVAPFESFNLGSHVQDDNLSVARNRQLLRKYLPSEPVWLNQVHGIDVVDAIKTLCIKDADASFSKNKNVVCVTMTADCLPVLLCNTQGTAVASIHAGWRSLCDGVIESTINAIGEESENLIAWLGPAIGPDAFEVGGEVREAFITKHAQAEDAFKSAGNKWLGNLYLLAKQRLNKQGVSKIYGGGECTYSNSSQYFSFRRDGITGRMATMIWFE
jgi:polyphenol oxidase